jgi:tetratricopeptide (TPR) repeat protein
LAVRRQARAGGGWALAIFLLAIAGQAWAEDSKQEARARYTTAESHYNLNEFQEALQDYKEAYRLFPDPVFLFNIAQCQRQIGNSEEAIKFYRSYLRNKPKAPNRQEVLRRIDEMQAAIDAKKSAPNRPPAGLAPPATGNEPHLPAPVPSAPPAPTPIPAVAPVAPTSPQLAPPPPTPPAAAPAPSVAPAARDDMQAGASSTRPDLVSQSSSSAPAAAPAFYQRWWFWTAAAAVVVVAGAGVGVYVVTSRSGSGAPNSKLGTRLVF